MGKTEDGAKRSVEAGKNKTHTSLLPPAARCAPQAELFYHALRPHLRRAPHTHCRTSLRACTRTPATPCATLPGALRRGAALRLRHLARHLDSAACTTLLCLFLASILAVCGREGEAFAVRCDVVDAQSDAAARARRRAKRISATYDRVGNKRGGNVTW